MTEAKHKGRAKRVHPGPDRWVRAALHAVANPNTVAGRLYQGRVALANTVAEEARRSEEGAMQAYSFMDFRGKKREFATCSVYCTVLEIQRKFGANTLARIAKAFEMPAYLSDDLLLQPLDKKTLKRAIHCYACGVAIRR